MKQKLAPKTSITVHKNREMEFSLSLIINHNNYTDLQCKNILLLFALLDVIFSSKFKNVGICKKYSDLIRDLGVV